VTQDGATSYANVKHHVAVNGRTTVFRPLGEDAAQSSEGTEGDVKPKHWLRTGDAEGDICYAARVHDAKVAYVVGSDIARLVTTKPITQADINSFTSLRLVTRTLRA
jgi:hypothetical protein